MRRRTTYLTSFIVLLAALVTVAVWSRLTRKDWPELDPQLLTVDGISLGMGYADVVRALGRPTSLSWEGECVAFSYFDEKQGGLTPCVWLHEEKVVFVSGSEVRHDGASLISAGESIDGFEARYGKAHWLRDIGMQWPKLGIVAMVTQTSGELDATRGFGLRSPSIHHSEWVFDTGLGTGASYPWFDRQGDQLYVPGISLGHYVGSSPQKLGVRIDAGYVRGFDSRLEKAEFYEKSGCVVDFYPFEVGQPLDPGYLRHIGRASLPDGRHFPDANSRVLIEDKKIVQMEIWVDDDPLFEALRKAN